MSQAISDSLPQTELSFNRWFVWKETRQLIPLTTALVVTAAGVLWIRLEMVQSWAQVDPLTLLAFPGLFAVGAGAVLVGQEREQRTLDWLTTLPIPNRQLITVKILVALIGLALMWCLVFLTIAVTGLGGNQQDPLTMNLGRIAASDFSPLIRYPIWVAHSAYVMLCSFLAAWRIKNVLIAIVTVMPLACLPLLMCEAILEVIYQVTGEHLEMAFTYWLRLAVLLLSVPMMWLLVSRTALAVLAPQPGPRYRVAFSIERLTSEEQQPSGVLENAPRFGSQITSILWQSIHSSRALWAALFAMMMLGIVVPFSNLGSDAQSRSLVWLDFLVLLSPLAVSWLGVSVFKNDGTPRRLQFLADRGIGPTKIYLGRHAMPIAIIATGLIAYAVAASRLTSSATANDSAESLPSLLAMTLVVAVIYSASQWASQLIRMMIVSVIAGPAIAIILLTWWSTAARLGSPHWMLAAFALLPMIATWRMMPRYMDVRDRPRSILMALAIALAIFALPVIPQVWGLAMVIRSGEIPEVASMMRLRETGQAAIENAPPIVRLHLWYVADADPAGGVLDDNVSREREYRLSRRWTTTPNEFLPQIVDLQTQLESGATIPQQTWKALWARLNLEYVTFAGAEEPERTDLIGRLGSWVDAASLIAQRLRRGPKWFDQEVADRLEFWLVETMQSPELAAHRDEKFFLDSAARFTDARQRNTARLAAVSASCITWRYPTPEERNSPNLDRDPLADRLAEGHYTIGFGLIAGDLETTAIVADKLLSGTEVASNETWTRQMHDAVFRDRLPFEAGPYAPRFRELEGTAAVEGSIRYPGRFWGLAWEDEADALKLAAATTGSSTENHGDDQ